MGALWQVAISNAALVAAGTPIVWLVGRFARRPALTHGLAVILLLKLITPPLWRIPVSWPEDPPTAPAVNHDVVVPGDRPIAMHESAKAIDRRFPAEGTIIETGPTPVEIPAVNIPAPLGKTAARFDFVQFCRRAVPFLGLIWAAGAALCAIIAGTRVVLFSRALRFATRAGAVQPRADMLARRLKLRHSPSVWFVPAHVPPMLWSLGSRPRLLLPKGLWDRLEIPGRDTILLHELAHWRRGDHVVRWIELLATCLYWWHPACWWARRELREAEEQCCDAWVLWAMPGVFKNYANALLEAVEFASVGVDRPSAQRAVPLLASRMGQFVHLRRRLTMLKHGNIARALSWGGLAGVMTLGSIVLPLTPTWGQERTAPEQGTVRAPEPAAKPAGPEASVSEEQAIVLDPRAEELRQDNSAAELEQAKRTIKELMKQLDIAQSRLQLLEARAHAQAATLKWRTYVRTYAPVPDAAPGALPGASGDQPYGHMRPGAGGPVMISPVPEAAPPAAPGTSYTPVAPGVHNGQYRVIITDPATGGIKEIQTRALDAVPEKSANQSQAERLDKIEAELRMMMDELAKMRHAAPPQPSPSTIDPFVPGRP